MLVTIYILETKFKMNSKINYLRVILLSLLKKHVLKAESEN